MAAAAITEFLCRQPVLPGLFLVLKTYHIVFLLT
jgi:hypothetical protein